MSEEKKPEEVTPTEGELKVEPEVTPEADKSVEEIASLKADKNNLVEEVKDMRVNNRKLKEQVELLTKEPEPTPAPDTDEDKTKDIVRTVLKEDKALRAKGNQTAAFKKFISENKEFSEDNDPTGLKREALETKLKRFNQEGLESIEDFHSVIEDANALLGGNTSSKATVVETTSTPVPSNDPIPQPSKDLNPKEEKLIESIGWDKDKYLKTRAKRPDYVEDLLAEIRD